MKSRKQIRRIAAICLAAGILVTGASAAANYVASGGYDIFKEGVKKIVFEEDNLSMNWSAEIDIDGVTLAGTKAECVYNGKDYAVKSTAYDAAGEEKAQHDVCLGGNHYFWNEALDSYTLYKGIDYGYQDTFPLMEDNEVNRRLVYFIEKLSDTVVGDLKNNIVQSSKENGFRTYSIRLSENQMPDIVSAGVSLVGAMMEEERIGYEGVWCEDEDSAFAVWYEQKTGEKLQDDFFAAYRSMTYEENDASRLSDAYWKMYEEMSEYYEKIAVENGGYLHVLEDGSYNTEEPEFEEDEFLIDGSLRICLAEGSFTVDRQNRITAMEGRVELTAIQDGAEHTYSMRINAEMGEYGTSKPVLFDTEGLECLEESKESAYDEEYVDDRNTSEVEVKFNGKVYHITVFTEDYEIFMSGEDAAEYTDF